MPLFNQTIPVVASEVEAVVSDHWGLILGKIIKASQNHTFEGFDENNTKFAVRVTPDAANKYFARIQSEIAFVEYVVKSNQVHYVCAPILNKSGEYIVRSGDLTIVVSEWAKGVPLDFMSYTWINDKDFVISWGKWLASFHAVSKQFLVQHPEITKSIQRWDEMHECILAGSDIHPLDAAVVTDIDHYGVLHGDLNLSNFFYVKDEHTLSVFDWDQTQQGE